MKDFNPADLDKVHQDNTQAHMKRGAQPYHHIKTKEIVSAVRVDRQTNIWLPGGGITSILAGDYIVTNAYGIDTPVRAIDFKKFYAPGKTPSIDIEATKPKGVQKLAPNSVDRSEP